MEVSWTTAALADLDEIQDFVAQESPIAAFKLIGDLIDRTDQAFVGKPDDRAAWPSAGYSGACDVEDALHRCLSRAVRCRDHGRRSRCADVAGELFLNLLLWSD